jgi:hypothetical protein
MKTMSVDLVPSRGKARKAAAKVKVDMDILKDPIMGAGVDVGVIAVEVVVATTVNSSAKGSTAGRTAIISKGLALSRWPSPLSVVRRKKHFPSSRPLIRMNGSS